GRTGHRSVAVVGAGGERWPPAEGEQAGGQLGAARSRLDGARGHPLELGLDDTRARLHPLEVAQDHREQVVEVMRDPARELADGLHLLRVTQGLLGTRQLTRARLYRL